MKTVKWFKEGDKIPSNGKLVKTEERWTTERPPEGGYIYNVKNTWFLYEIEFESNEGIDQMLCENIIDEENADIDWYSVKSLRETLLFMSRRNQEILDKLRINNE